jgi:hypothetical protein
MIRSFDIAEGLHLRDDGNVIEGWVLPFNQPADVYDVDGEGTITRYREGFLPGCCEKMEQGVKARGNASFIKLTMDHDSSFDSRVGVGMSLEQRGAEGVWASFKLYRGVQLDKVRSMIEESHDSFSVEFDDVAPPVEEDGVTWRRQIAIPVVTLTPMPAYAGARVMSMRDGQVELDTPGLNELTAWLESNKTAPGS